MVVVALMLIFPVFAALIFLILDLLGMILLRVLPFLLELIVNPISRQAIILAVIGYITTLLSPEFFGFSSIVLLMGAIIFGILGFPILALIFGILAFVFAVIALCSFIINLLNGVDLFGFWKNIFS